MITAEKLIEHFGLEPLHGEGGYFKRTYSAEESIPHDTLPTRYTASKLFGSAIFYLLEDDEDSFSALHKLPTDEIYHFYLGDPVEMLLLHPNGESERVILGHTVLDGQHVQFVVPRDVWQGSSLVRGGRYALLGTTMAPAYDDEDFELGDRDALLAAYPGEAELIKALTRLK